MAGEAHALEKWSVGLTVLYGSGVKPSVSFLSSVLTSCQAGEAFALHTKIRKNGWFDLLQGF